MLSNRYGRFDATGSIFSVTDYRTPMPWTNVVCNGRYGFVVSQNGGGFSWLDNSQLNVLTRWDMDMVRDGGQGGSEVRMWLAAVAAAGAAGCQGLSIDYYSDETTIAVGAGIVHAPAMVQA